MAVGITFLFGLWIVVSRVPAPVCRLVGVMDGGDGVRGEEPVQLFNFGLEPVGGIGAGHYVRYVRGEPSGARLSGGREGVEEGRVEGGSTGRVTGVRKCTLFFGTGSRYGAGEGRVSVGGIRAVSVVVASA